MSRISRFDILAFGIDLTYIQGYFVQDWSSRPVVCTCVLSRVTGYCRFMKFYRRKSINKTFNLGLFITPADRPSAVVSLTRPSVSVHTMYRIGLFDCSAKICISRLCCRFMFCVRLTRRPLTTQGGLSIEERILSKLAVLLSVLSLHIPPKSNRSASKERRDMLDTLTILLLVN